MGKGGEGLMQKILENEDDLSAWPALSFGLNIDAVPLLELPLQLLSFFP